VIDGNGYNGLYLYYSDYDFVLGNEISGNGGDGIYMEYANHGVFRNNTISYNSYGIEFYDESDYNLIENNIFENNTYYGVYLYYGYYNHIYNNTFLYNNGAGDTYDSSHVQAYDGESGDNYWNSTTYGNYWSDWTSPDSDGDGIVDNPYNIDGGAVDNYPLTEPAVPIPEFSAIPILALAILFLALRRR
jgi:parallel beta-helix repeat protein